MDCRETRTLLTPFHDGELPAADRARVEEHLRGCPECRALLADLARADKAAGVPDPGPAYWDRFNARVMDRVEREADGPGVAVLRPKGGWMRQQLRYLVPAAAAAALVVVVVRYGGMFPGAPAPTVPPAGSLERAAPPPSIARERSATVAREEPDRLADRRLSETKEEASRDRAATPAAVSAPAPPPVAFRGDPAGSPTVAGTDRLPSRVQGERKKMAEGAVPMEERQVAGKAESDPGTRIAKDPSAAGAPSAAYPGSARPKPGPSPLASAPSPGASPCERAATLAERERFREAEAAQRACLAEDLPEPAREKGLVFLAELLDRQARFAEADAIIADVDRRFPQSRPLDLYRQQRPMVQKQPMSVPVTR